MKTCKLHSKSNNRFKIPKADLNKGVQKLLRINFSNDKNDTKSI